MLVVNFDTQETNFLIAGDATFFLLETEAGRHALVEGKCRHRGGPLHLASPDKSGRKLVCPWHDARIPLKWLVAGAMPMVCIDDHAAVALLPVPQETKVHLARRRTTLGLQCKSAPLHGAPPSVPATSLYHAPPPDGNDDSSRAQTIQKREFAP